MRKLCLPLRRILLSFVIVVAALAGASGLAWAEPVCQVTGLRGTATLEHDTVRAPLAAGAELAVGDMIITDAGARVKLRFADGSEVRLGENAQLRIDFAKIDTAAGTRNILLRLPLGLLRAVAAKLPQNTGSSFEVHTGIAYSAVRGTEWIVVASGTETRVYVQEGRVAVGADFKTEQFPKLVEGGRWVHVSRRSGIGAVQDSPAGSTDSLIEQTEASVTGGTPDTAVTEVTESTTETTTDAVSTAKDAVSAATTGAVSTAKDAVSAATTGAVSAATGAVSAATGAVSAATGAVTGAASGAVDQATSAASAATSAVSSTTSKVTSAIDDTLSAVTGDGDDSASGGGGGSTSGGGSGDSSGGSSDGSSGSSSGGSSGSGPSSGDDTSSSGSSGSGGSSGSSGSSGSGKSPIGSVRDAIGGALGGLL